MKILYLLQDFPYPLTNGVRVKVFNLISYMAKRHECHILSFGDENLHSRTLEFQRKVPRARILNLYPPCCGLKLQLSRVAHFVRGEPVFLARSNSNAFHKAVQQAIETTQYDVVHLDAFGMAPYVRLFQSIPTVISTTDAMSKVYTHATRASSSFLGKAYRFYESKSVGRFERKMLPLFSKTHVVAKFDRDYLTSSIPGADVEYIEHMVPDEVLRYPDTTPCALSGKKRILFTGAVISESIAQDLLKFLSVPYPVIYKECPDVEVVILGHIASGKLQNKIKQIPGVRLLGWVDDYLCELMKAQVLIFLDWSRMGIKTRVLYALGLGKAIVATPEAVEGLDVSDGVHYFEREVGRGFAEAVISLLNNQKLRETMGQRARRLILCKYNMKIAGPKWSKLYESAIIKNQRKLCAEKTK